MLKPLPIVVGILTVGLVGVSLIVMNREPVAVGVESNSYNIQEVPRHPVTKEMEVNAESFVGKKGPEFSLVDSEGIETTADSLIGGQPSVLVMTKDGCPCSIESQPYWTSMSLYYGPTVKFLGIIDVDSKGGKKFKTDFMVPYPILSSTDDKVFRAFGAKQSVYVYLFDRDGVIQKVWPGYSRAMLTELNKLLSEMTGKESEPTDYKMVPEKMTSGCFFFQPVGTDKPAW